MVLSSFTIFTTVVGSLCFFCLEFMCLCLCTSKLYRYLMRYLHALVHAIHRTLHFAVSSCATGLYECAGPLIDIMLISDGYTDARLDGVLDMRSVYTRKVSPMCFQVLL
jgi:hypothetical protein